MCSYYLRKDQLFKVDNNSPRLPSKDAELSHSHVAKLLFTSKRARPNIPVCITFLYTQVRSPMEQDYKKLGRVNFYLKETVHIPFVICVDNSGTLTWNIYALFTVHSDCKSHTRACLTLRHESVVPLWLK